MSSEEFAKEFDLEILEISQANMNKHKTAIKCSESSCSNEACHISNCGQFSFCISHYELNENKGVN